MNKNVLSHLISISLFLTVLVLLVGCQLGEVEKAAASSSIPPEVKSTMAIDPADRKFFDGNYGAYDAASKSLANLANIDPADRKFFDGGYGVNYVASGSLAHLSNIDPADRKFFNGGYAANYDASGSLVHLSNINPADRKFFSGGYLVTGSEAKLTVGEDLANRHTSSGN